MNVLMSNFLILEQKASMIIKWNWTILTLSTSFLESVVTEKQLFGAMLKFI